MTIHNVGFLIPELETVRRLALTVGCIGLGLCAIGGIFQHDQFFQSYLVAYLFWLGIALGCLPIVMLYHLTGGRWGSVVRRLLESGMRTLPWMALLFGPLLPGIRNLYAWARPEQVAGDPVLQHQSIYLNVPFFVIRAFIYFAVWNLLAFYLNKWSSEQDRTGEAGLLRRFQLLSGPGLVAYGITVTFASVDWAMSLDTHWFSTIYGMMFMIAQILSAFAFVIPLLAIIGHRGANGIVTPHHFLDLGNLMLTFVMLWAYVAFSQFLIIWSGNLSDEIPWYLRRTQNGWGWIAITLIVFHFFLPFLLLLSRNAKRSKLVLSGIALCVMFMSLVDLFWLIVPAFLPGQAMIHWSDIAAVAGIGGIWVYLYARAVNASPLFPVQDPNFVPYGEPS
jgi:hypothetical protein